MALVTWYGKRDCLVRVGQEQQTVRRRYEESDAEGNCEMNRSVR